jgi:hypothetical protein
MDRINVASTNYSEFVEKYQKTATPVVIEGWLAESPKIAAWNLNRLAAECGGGRVSGAHRRESIIKMMMSELSSSPFASFLVNQYTQSRYHSSLEQELVKAQEFTTLQEYVKRIKKMSIDTEFRSLLDYIMSSVTIHDTFVDTYCDPLADDFRKQGWGNWAKENLGKLTTTQPQSFIEPHGARAYPAHQHGSDYTHNFQVMLEGSKRVVFWPYSERANLYPAAKLTTDNADEVYLADGVGKRFDLFPAMAQTRALEATLRPGETIYLPNIGIHVLESEQASLGIRFGIIDEISTAQAHQLRETQSYQHTLLKSGIEDRGSDIVHIRGGPSGANTHPPRT